MARVRFTNHLKRFFPHLQSGEQAEGATVAEVIASLDARHPGFARYIVDERGALRKHVNIFIEEDLVTDRERLSDPVRAETTVFIMQALSGG
jgi:hypothetical protein